MNGSARSVKVLQKVSPAQFRDEIYAARQPVVLKGLVDHWPAVAAGRESPDAVADYISGFDAGTRVETILGRPEIDGKFFYNENLDGLNFATLPETISKSARRILSFRGEARPPTIYLQSVSIPEYLPGFQDANRIPVVDPSVEARIWMGNRVTVQTHFDLKENIACVIAGRRRFTLFPPSQTPNLYPGPFELTLSGPPVSMVQLDAPDIEKYPRFSEALQHAQVADLEPGDAIYIPYFWWHHVRALDDLNVLVNYWWNDADPDIGSPYDALLHAILKIRDLPENQREAWRTMFGSYAFGEHGDPVAHLPDEKRGLLGAHSLPVRQQIRKILLESIARDGKVAAQRQLRSADDDG